MQQRAALQQELEDASERGAQINALHVKRDQILGKFISTKNPSAFLLILQMQFLKVNTDRNQKGRWKKNWTGS